MVKLYLPIPPEPPPPPTVKVIDARRHLKDAREALQRSDAAWNSVQILDSINSAQLFIKMAKAALEDKLTSGYVVTNDKFGKSTVRYRQVGQDLDSSES